MCFLVYQLGLMPFSPRDRESIYEAVKKSDVVINLIGKHYETKHLVPTRRTDGTLSRVNYDFEEVHATIPRVIAEVAKEAGVPAFIHVSSLSADPNSKSKWSRTKAAGEAAVREVYPDSVIVRPATIFGPEDRFLNWIAETMARAPYFPLLNGGSTLVQPVYAVDVGKAIFRIIEVRVSLPLHRTVGFSCIHIHRYGLGAMLCSLQAMSYLKTFLLTNFISPQTGLQRIRRQDLRADRPRRVHLQGGGGVRRRGDLPAQAAD